MYSISWSNLVIYLFQFLYLTQQKDYLISSANKLQEHDKVDRSFFLRLLRFPNLERKLYCVVEELQRFSIIDRLLAR